MDIMKMASSELRGEIFATLAKTWGNKMLSIKTYIHPSQIPQISISDLEKIKKEDLTSIEGFFEIGINGVKYGGGIPNHFSWYAAFIGHSWIDFWVAALVRCALALDFSDYTAISDQENGDFIVEFRKSENRITFAISRSKAWGQVITERPVDAVTEREDLSGVSVSSFFEAVAKFSENFLEVVDSVNPMLSTLEEYKELRNDTNKLKLLRIKYGESSSEEIEISVTVPKIVDFEHDDLNNLKTGLEYFAKTLEDIGHPALSEKIKEHLSKNLIDVDALHYLLTEVELDSSNHEIVRSLAKAFYKSVDKLFLRQSP